MKHEWPPTPADERKAAILKPCVRCGESVSKDADDCAFAGPFKLVFVDDQKHSFAVAMMIDVRDGVKTG